MIKKFIDLNYLQDEYLWDNTNVSGGELFTTREIEKLIQKASGRIENILTIPRFDSLDSLAPSAQEAIKLATAILFDSYTMNGENYTDIIKNITIGEVNVSHGGVGMYSDIPQEAKDVLKRNNLFATTLFEGDTTEDPIFSSAFMSGEQVQYGTIVQALNSIKENTDEYELPTLDKVFELINDITAGAIEFKTGETVNNISLEGESLTIYKKDMIDSMIIALESEIALKANKSDVVTNNEFLLDQNRQDTFITNNSNTSAQNRVLIRELAEILELGGAVVEIFQQNIDRILSNTAIKINPDIKVESTRPAVVSYTQETNYKTIDLFANGTLRIKLTGDVEKRNTTALTTIKFNLRRFEDDTIVDTFQKAFDFTSTTRYSNQTGSFNVAIADIGEEGKEEERLYIEILTLETGNEIVAKTGTVIEVDFLTTKGDGVIETSDGWVNLSNLQGSIGTDALNNADERLAFQESLINTLADGSTVIYGSDFAGGTTPMITQRNITGFVDITNDTTVDGENGKEVIENLELSIETNTTAIDSLIQEDTNINNKLDEIYLQLEED